MSGSGMWGKATPEQWQAAKEAGFGSDEVPDNVYTVEAAGFNHITPDKNKKGIGTYILRTITVPEGNDPAFVGKKLELSYSYHPTSTADNYQKMNNISLQNAVKTVEACGVEAATDHMGFMDAPASLEMLPNLKSRFKVTVTHEWSEKDKKNYMRVGNPQPLLAE